MLKTNLRKLHKTIGSFLELMRAHFLVPFCGASFVAAAGLYTISLVHPDFLLSSFIPTIGVALLYIGLAIWYSSNLKGILAQWVIIVNKIIFLVTTISLFIANRISFDAIDSTELTLILLSLAIGSGCLMVYATHQPQKKAPISLSRVWHVFLLLFIIGNGFFISIQNLGILPPQNDEFLTYNAVKYITQEGLTFKDLSYGADSNASPDFYSRALPYSLGVAGLVEVAGRYDSIFDLRLLSAILGSFTLLMLYLIFRGSVPAVVLFLGLYFFSIFYLFVYHSRVARMYSLLLLICMALVYIFLKVFDDFSQIEGFAQKTWSGILAFIRRNWVWLAGFFALLFVGLKTHYNVGLFVLPFLLYIVAHAKSKYLKIISVLGLALIAGAVVLTYFGLSPIDITYFNSTGEINYNFIAHLFRYYQGHAATLVFFAIPLIGYKRLPVTIRFSYFSFISIFTFLLVVSNGVQFHDPRYFIFLFPLYTFLVIYGIWVAVKSLITTRREWLVIALVLVLSVIFVGKIQLGGVCKENLILGCPISDASRVFNLDRWSYQYDEPYTVVKENLAPGTIFVGRTLHKFYADKYGIEPENECLVLKDYTQNRRCSWDDILNHNIVFVVYPSLIYTKVEREKFDEMYNYLYQNQNKVLLYESHDSRILIYKITASANR